MAQPGRAVVRRADQPQAPQVSPPQLVPRRYRNLHAAARLTRGGHQRRLKIHASWAWAGDIVTAWNQISALPQAP